MRRSRSWFSLRELRAEQDGARDLERKYVETQLYLYPSTTNHLPTVPQEVGLNSVIGDFGPTYDNKTVFYDYQNRSREGKFIRTPVLAGANKNESTLFAFLAATSGTAMNQTQKDGVQNGFNCPNDFVAQNRRNFGINAWRYFYMAEFPNAAVVPGVDFGTFHGAEVQQIFNTSASASTVPEYGFCRSCALERG